MNSELEIQAYLDNELTSAEARRVALRLDKEAEAQRLYRELRATRRALLEAEPEHRLDAPRDFYFTQILRRIEQAEAEAEVREALPWWRRAVAPVAGFAAVAAAAFLLARTAGPTPQFAQETVHASSAMTFHSQADGITIVWIDGQYDLNN